mmetsp:Transcript_8061/g.20061  ORF Transcript_8061/g.20061 Transcript_8061/m.20061 type:complete len:689 (+) Transcript_8061:284-2350(+)|eukprot:CAMPEP_0197181698 /NCGR_PEP_ID=MMETSP1423-20130617/5903_1 /TAXON_ID=476441 /ORGANISM="Pseudo-nitzschia heimii, Strain UNC1101" /LENGTH=688 /DNA_ID=CAMNT_0042631995 /DNA_START=272 /DNA_END=2338 /DNA_ORIENTATION=+
MANRPDQEKEENREEATPREGRDRDEEAVRDSFDSGFRGLYEQSQSSTLWFTSATSLFSGIPRTAYAGIYQCTLEADSNFDDFNDGDESRESCKFANLLADWTTFEGTQHHELILRNLQFDLSSLRSSEPNESKNEKQKKKKKQEQKQKPKQNYLYATTHNSYKATRTIIEPNPLYDDDLPVPIVHTETRPDWEILRAELPSDANDYEGTALNPDGTLRFESVFRTDRTIASWNECDFECCVRNDRPNVDDRHAYAETTTRSFVVDEHTGDIFVSWEGFYEDCESRAYDSGKKLQWTIGVSRLKKEEPGCFMLDRDADDDYFEDDEATHQKLHFPRCTEPVAIAYRSTRGREIVLPHGGFVVVPASDLGDGTLRSFLLSVLENKEGSKTPSKVSASIISVPEGHDGISHADIRTEIVSSSVDGSFWAAETWDGGSLRLHYDPSTKKPDHLCWTAYDQGIGCRKVSTTEHHDGTPIVYFPGTDGNEVEPFLSPEQTARFCKLDKCDDDENAPRASTPFVAGLDVRWNPDGSPSRIFFGCGGSSGNGGAMIHSGSGTFGSVSYGGSELRRTLEGAFAQAVVFLPAELEGTTDPSVVAAAAAARASREVDPTPEARSGWIAVPMVLIAAAALALYHRRWRQRHFQRSPTWSVSKQRTPIRFRTPYVELQNLDGSSSWSTSSSSGEGFELEP